MLAPLLSVNPQERLGFLNQHSIVNELSEIVSPSLIHFCGIWIYSIT
jgi:hypothetical protein